MRLLPCALAAIAAAAACTSSSPSSSEPPCVTGLDTSCQATYDPATYDAVFSKILQPTCATGRGTCHTADAAKGGLVLEDEGQAYGMLLGRGGAHARVLPGDPSCSLIMKRLTSSDPSYHMPPGSTSIPAGDLCTITKWIAAGAQR